MSLDLLTARVDPSHALYGRLADFGLSDALRRIIERPTPPDIVGFNHYITSDRFLDDRLEHYPSNVRGGNGVVEYADVEAVRVLGRKPCGWTLGLRQLWRRYGLPIAITECHLGCAPEERKAWLMQTWTAARAARRRGIDVRALTVWSLLGAYDWDSLLTRSAESYEPGVFSLVDGEPVPTELENLVQRLGRQADGETPLGWWNRQERLLYPAWTPTATPMSDTQLSL